MAVTLYRPRLTYRGDDGIDHKLDKWGEYPHSLHAIPPPMSANPELRRNASDNQFQLVQWAQRYWRIAAGGVRNDTPFVQGDEAANPGWPGNRYQHVFTWGFEYDQDTTIEPVDRILRVANTIDGIAERYLLLFNLYRGQRTLYWALMFDVRGTVNGSALLEAAYIPIAIVYCPPGQDMTNSLIESQVRGTRFTFATGTFVTGSEATQIGTSLEGQYGAAGVNIALEEGLTDSQTFSDRSSSVVRITTTQETTITANNQRAIGRANWGPLGDLFVILKDVMFHGVEVFDEDSGYALVPISESPRTTKMVLSTVELLVPPNGSVAATIPWDQRKAILKLNPFVVRDEAVLDQVNAGALPVNDAVDPEADPNTGANPTRAVRVLRVALGQGSELNFYTSSSIGLEKEESHAESYTTTFSSANYVGLDIGIPLANVGFSNQFQGSQTINYQTTAELRQEVAKTETAKCFLIRNQNDLNHGTLDVFYDTVFGTFLFKAAKEDAGCLSSTLR